MRAQLSTLPSTVRARHYRAAAAGSCRSNSCVDCLDLSIMSLVLIKESERGGLLGNWVLFFALAVLSVLFRIPPLLNARGVNSDAAVVGLQALHILQGEWSWFLWGAPYQASFDA